MHPETRYKNRAWILSDASSCDHATLAVLMDIRDELQTLNAVFRCPSFQGIPFTLCLAVDVIGEAIAALRKADHPESKT